MKKILSILLVSIIIIGCQNEVIKEIRTYNLDEITSPNDTLTFLKKDMSLVSGFVNYVGNIKGKFIEGKKEGLHIEQEWYGPKSDYYEGYYTLEENYVNGVRNGISRKWWGEESDEFRDKLLFEKNYKDGKIDGIEKKWYFNGQLKREATYNHNNPDGLTRSWHDNGQLKDQLNYKDGELISQKCWSSWGGKIECE